MSNKKSIQDLKSFIDTTQKILQGIVNDEDWFIDDTLRELARAAWSEVKINFALLQSQITEQNGDRLAEHGLSGQQLEFKLQAMNFFIEEKSKRNEGKILRAINIILGSLCFLPHAEPIREFKDFLELCRKER